MNQLMKKCLSLVLVLTMIITCFPGQIRAEEGAETSGTYGNITWTFQEEERLLTVEGEGAVEPDENGGFPWDPFFTEPGIAEVVFGEGINDISQVAFPGVRKVTALGPIGYQGLSKYQFDSNLAWIEIPNSDSFKTYDGALYNYDFTQLEFVPASRSQLLHVHAYTRHIGITIDADQLEGVYFEGNEPDIFYYGPDYYFYKEDDSKVFTMYYQKGNPTWSKIEAQMSVLLNQHPDSILLETWGDGTVTGELAEGFTWSYQNGVLTFTGSGAMPDLEWSDTTLLYREFDPEEIRFEDGITYVGNYTAYQLSPARIVFADSVKELGEQSVTEFSGTTLNLNQIEEIGDSNFWACDELKKLVIPDTVTSLGKGCFQSMPKVTQITLGKGITSLPDLTLEGGYPLLKKYVVTEGSKFTTDSKGSLLSSTGKTLYRVPGGIGSTYSIPSTVTKVGEKAFIHQPFTTIKIGANVTTLPSYVFGRTYQLENITVNANNTKYSSVDGVLYNKEQTQLIKYPPRKTDMSYTIGSKVTKIVYAAFENANSLQTVKMPNTVKTIEKMAFDGCTNLTSVTLGRKVTNIGVRAFNMTAVKKLVIPETVISIGASALPYRYDLTPTVYFRGSVTDDIKSNIFGWGSMTVYYPKNDATWSSFVNDTSLSRITWKTWTPPIYLTASMISAIKDRTYTGKALKPAVTVKAGTKTLTKDTHYTVSYKNNVNVGTATVTIKGTGSTTKSGSYIGSAKKTFKIVKAKQPMTVTAVQKTVKASALKTAKVTVTALTVKKAQGAVTYAKVSGSSKLTVNKTTGKITVAKGTKAGTYKIKVKVTAKGNSNYLSGSKTVTVTIIVK